MLQYNELDADPNAKTLKSIYVYEAPVRLWHWVQALAITTLAATGFLIAYPLPSFGGEASDHYFMGWVRFVHFTAGYVLAVVTLLRVYWAFVGNDYAKQLFLVPVWNRQYWREMWHEIRWYGFMTDKPLKYGGHNPLAQFFMAFVLMTTTFFMIATGFAMYSEGEGRGGWADRLFGWVIPLMGQSQDVHTWHHLGMWVIIVFVMIHLYAAVREDITSRQSIMSTMVSGYRTFKD
jgi:Ni/Fe-hydrogenase 1 B-type cytochrome subunit